MKKSNRNGYKGESWKHIERIIAWGHSPNQVFEDWLDLMLSAILAFTDNAVRGNIKEGSKFDGVYEERYLEIMRRYDNTGKMGERPADYFAAAYGALRLEIENSGGDPLGDIYMREITYGEHGQFFTPQSVADMMAEVIHAPSKSEEGREVVYDPCCGSGVMLLAAAKQNPDARLVGIDLDARCAKMAALNMSFRGLSADIYQGDSLAAKMGTVWMVRFGGFMQEQEKPETPDRVKQYAKEQQGRLFDLAA